MRIGVDVRPLQNNNLYRGTGRYLACLLDALSQVDDESEYHFYVDEDALEPAILEQFPRKRIIDVPYVNVFRRRYLRSVLPQHGKLRVDASETDVFLQIDASLGVPETTPTVVAFLDLIPSIYRDRPTGTTLRLKVREWLALQVYWRRYRRVLRNYQHASSIITISECSKRDFVHYVRGVASLPITVTPLAPIRPRSLVVPCRRSQDSLGRYFIRSPFLLYVGGIDIRKNVAGLARDFFQLCELFADLNLVVVGKDFEFDAQLRRVGWDDSITRHPFYNRIVKTGYVDDDDLAILYEHAEAFVFPSRYEGFGLPLVEAMQAGCPVIAYDNSSISEVVGDAALIVADGTSMVPAIGRLLTDPSLRQEMIVRGREQASKFSWEKTASLTLDVLQSTARKEAAGRTGVRGSAI